MQDKTTPAEQVLTLDEKIAALSPHFVSLGLDADQNMALVLTMVCATDWVCYPTANVRLMPGQALGKGALVRLTPVGDASAEALLGHALALVQRNRRIEARRVEIQQQQALADAALREEITELMTETGGFELATRLVAAPQAPAPYVPNPVSTAPLQYVPTTQLPAPVYVPQYEQPAPKRHLPAGVMEMQGRPDITVQVRELEDVDPTSDEADNFHGAAPTLEELARRI